MNGTSGQFCDSYFTRTKRKCEMDPVEYENGQDAPHLHKRKCLRLESALTEDYHNHWSFHNSEEFVNDIDMKDDNHAISQSSAIESADIDRSSINNNLPNGSSQTSDVFERSKNEMQEVRCYCRPHWKIPLYEFGPFF